MRKNKLIMWGTLGFLALVLALVLYSYFGGAGSSATNNATNNIQQNTEPPAQWLPMLSYTDV